MNRILTIILVLLVSACSSTSQREPAGPDSPPVLLVSSPPPIPFALAKSGASGSAVVEFVVDVDGSVIEARVLSATHQEFGASAAACVKTWKFEPGTYRGKPTRTKMRQSFSF